MQITFSPMRADMPLVLHRAGDLLTINGDVFDFSVIPEGATLPRDAIECAYIASDVTRRYTAALDMHIQATARNAAFVDALSLVSYAQSRNHVWKAQARAFLVWRDTVWEYAQEAFETLDPSQELESNLAAFIAGAPKINWP